MTRRQALDFFRSDDLIGLGMEADAVRRRLHPEGVVTYILDRSIPFTPNTGSNNGSTGHEGRFDFETIYNKVAESVESGASGVLLQGGLQPGVGIEPFEALLQGIRQRYPGIWLHCFSAPEILAIAGSSGISLTDTIARLRDAGLDSITGGGADILDDEIRHAFTTLKCSTEDWLLVHRTAHRLGIRTAATMKFGAGETFEQRLDHFEQLHRLQQETGGFAAFTPWVFQSTAPGARALDEATAVEYLKVLAVSRLYLDNILNLQSSWGAQGLKVLQMGLRFGGNDVGSVMFEESIRTSGGPEITTEEDLRRVIRDAGFKPVQRDTLYRTMYLN